MTKNYQTRTGDTSALAMPERARWAMEEIAADIREGLLALAVGAGLQMMAQLNRDARGVEAVRRS